MPRTAALADALEDVQAHTRQMPEHGFMRDGLPTGFEDLDRALCGLRPGEVTVLAGSASVGLTSLAVSIARHVMRTARRNVVWASVDEDVPEVARNFLASQALVPSEKLRLGALSPTERARCDEAARALTRSSRPGQPSLYGFEAELNPLDVVAGRDTTLGDVDAAVHAMPEAGLLVVDDLKRLLYNEEDTNPDRDSRHIDGQVMQALCRLATSHRLHLVATVRLYRTWHRSGEPTFSDFAPFRDLHNMADNVVGVWREDLHDEDSPERGIMRLTLLRSSVGGHFSGRLGHVLDRRLVANLARE